jgi:hypothetical protein
MGKRRKRMGDDLALRLIKCAASVAKVVDAIPDTRLGRHIAGQLDFRIPHSLFRIPHSRFRIPDSAFPIQCLTPASHLVCRIFTTPWRGVLANIRVSRYSLL